MNTFKKTISFIREQFGEPESFIPLHEPRFIGREREYVNDAIDSTFVSSVGEYVNRFEKDISNKVGVKYTVATSNGTSAIHAALIISGVKYSNEVITQALTFVATSNAISYVGANPVFLDVDIDTMSLSPLSLKRFLKNETYSKNGRTYNKKTGAHISACLPMHTFGFSCRIDEIVEICNQYNILVIEDAAESLGTTFKGRQTGTFGKLGVYSFNGNKTITSGGGGVIVTDCEKLAKLAKHITTTAKVNHSWEFYHDMIGYNYRMPNLNAALACAQLEQLDNFIERKRKLASNYINFFKDKEINFISEPLNCRSNYWLMCLGFKNPIEKSKFLKFSNENKIMTRPVWQLMFRLPMYKNCYRDDQKNAIILESTVINIPSSVIF
tara:strand:- start:1714 stop:2862 length:1149 start_codon:yes stop_codon:yes gene_type:complete